MAAGVGLCGHLDVRVLSTRTTGSHVSFARGAQHFEAQRHADAGVLLLRLECARGASCASSADCGGSARWPNGGETLDRWLRGVGGAQRREVRRDAGRVMVSPSCRPWCQPLPVSTVCTTDPQIQGRPPTHGFEHRRISESVNIQVSGTFTPARRRLLVPDEAKRGINGAYHSVSLRTTAHDGVTASMLALRSSSTRRASGQRSANAKQRKSS